MNPVLKSFFIRLALMIGVTFVSVVAVGVRAAVTYVQRPPQGAGTHSPAHAVPSLQTAIERGDRRNDAIRDCLESGQTLERLTTDVQDALARHRYLGRRDVSDPPDCWMLAQYRNTSPYLDAVVSRYVAARHALAQTIRDLSDGADARDPEFEDRIDRFYRAADVDWVADLALRDLRTKSRAEFYASIEAEISPDSSRAADVRILRVVQAADAALVALRHVERASTRAEARDRLSVTIDAYVAAVARLPEGPRARAFRVRALAWQEDLMAVKTATDEDVVDRMRVALHSERDLGAAFDHVGVYY